MQSYVIKFVNNLWQVGGFLRPDTLVSSTNKTDRHDIAEILMKVALNTIILSPYNKLILYLPGICLHSMYFNCW